MNIELVVVQPFAGRARGEVVTDPAEIARVLASNPHCVVSRAAPAPAPAPTPAPAPAPAPVPAPAPAPAPVKGN